MVSFLKQPHRLAGLALAAGTLIVPIASADIILVDEGALPRNGNPKNISFSLYNNAGLQSNGGTDLATVGSNNPITGTPAEASSGTKSLTMFTIDDHVFTGSHELFEIQLGDEGEAQFTAGLTGTNESTTAERDMRQFDVANGGTGTLDLQFSYRVKSISFVPGFDNSGTAVLPTALPMNRLELRYLERDTNPIVPGNQSSNETLAVPIGINLNPVDLVFDDQWHTETFTLNVRDEAGRDALGVSNDTDSNIATVFTLGFDNLGDLDNDIKVAYELFIDNVRILTAGGITGDFNGSGQVEQGDLDLVLQNWGDDTAVTGIPTGWTNDNDSLGQIEQTELDRVLQNWGSTSAPDFAGSAVPEPATLALLSLGGLAMLRRRTA